MLVPNALVKGMVQAKVATLVAVVKKVKNHVVVSDLVLLVVLGYGLSVYLLFVANLASTLSRLAIL